MRQRGGKFLIGAIIVVGCFLVLNGYLLRRMRTVYAPAAETRARWYDWAGQARELVGYFGQWYDLARHNESLEEQLTKATVAEASLESLRSENDFLRKAAGLKTNLNRSVVPAGLFNVSMTPNGYSALINKGARDGVTADSIVVSASGVLVGRIKDVFSDSARVLLVSDPSFSITVRVMGGTASGIAKGALDKGMTLELIVQTDQVSEGDTLVSTGNDTAPAGLVVGTVSNVQSNDTQLFKSVIVKPAVDLTAGDVVIIER